MATAINCEDDLISEVHNTQAILLPNIFDMTDGNCSSRDYLDKIILNRMSEFKHYRTYEFPIYTYYLVLTPFKNSSIKNIEDLIRYFRKRGYERIVVTKEHYTNGRRINPHFNVIITTKCSLQKLHMKNCNVHPQLISDHTYNNYQRMFTYIYKEYYENLFEEFLFSK